MMRRIVILLVLLLSAGCASRVPLATNHPLTTQKKAKAAHHWDVLADDIAHQTQLAAFGTKSVLHDKALYIQPRGTSAFDTAFRNFLITRMVNRGLPVTTEVKDGVAVSYDIQLLRHDSSRYTHVPGTLTALAAGIWVIRGIVGSAAAAIPTTLGLTGLADFALGHYAGEATHTELIVTTSILNNATYLLRKTDIYYIEDADTDLFTEALDRPVKQLGVVGR
jgi:hypothetical protein